VVGDLAEAVKIGLPINIEKLGITKEDYDEISTTAASITTGT
jgi:glycerol dehydrogenase-like iron-containing ADH family enzyme